MEEEKHYYTKEEKKKYFEEKIKPFYKKIEGYYEEFIKNFDKVLAGEDTVYNNYINFLLQFPELSANNIATAYFESNFRGKKIDFMFKRFNVWKNKYERTVKEGEKAYFLLEPKFQFYPEKTIEYNLTNNSYDIKNPEADEPTKTIWTEGERIGFSPYPTFDISQTEGKELPIETPFHRLGTNTKPELIKKLEVIINNLNIKFGYDDLGKTCNGFTDGKQIVINKKLSTDDRALTGYHELTHFLSHYKKVKNKETGEIEREMIELTRQQKEIDAELSSFLIGRLFGLKSKGYRYVAVYKATGELLRESMDRIYPTIKRIVRLINNINLKDKTTKKQAEPKAEPKQESKQTPKPIIKVIAKPQETPQQPQQQIKPLPVTQTTLILF